SIFLEVSCGSSWLGGCNVSSPSMLRRHAPRAVTAILFLLAISATHAAAYSVAVRWTGDGEAATAGYRLYVTPAGGSERPPIDVPRPRHDGSGRFESVVG